MVRALRRTGGLWMAGSSSQDAWHPVVAVPVRNEEKRIAALLRALDEQSWCRIAPTPLPVVLVLNNCTDRTRAVVETAASHRAHLRIDLIDVDLAPPFAHVGTARRMAMERAAAMAADGRGVILTTDADAVPDPDWIAATLRAVERGADLVGGKLYGNRREEARLGAAFNARAAAAAAHAMHCDRLASLIDPLNHDPWPRHSDHTGGSLAIRADIYRAIGGLPPLPRREDTALVVAARAAGARLVHPLDVRVEVSARLIGRAAGGMADCLKAWMRAETEGLPFLVEDPARLEARLKRRRAVRDLAQLSPIRQAAAAASLGIDPSALSVGGDPLSAAHLVERLAPDDLDPEANVPVAEAIARLCTLISDYEGTMRAA